MNPDDPSQPASQPSQKVPTVTIQSLSPGGPSAGPVSTFPVAPAASPPPASPQPPTTPQPSPTTSHAASRVPAPHVFHPPLAPAPARRENFLAKYWRKVGGGSLIISLLVHAGLLIGAYFVIREVVTAEKPVDFLPGGGAKGAQAASDKLAKSVKQKKRSTINKSVPMRKVVSLNSVSAIKLSDVPMDNIAMPEMSSLMGGMSGSGGFGGGGAGGGFGTGQGIGTKKGFTPMTFFGRVGGEGLPGAFYDMKQDRNSKPLPYTGSFNEYMEVINKAAGRRFAPSALKDYYKAKQEVSFTYLMVPNMAAQEGPKCFNVEKEVEPRGWFVHYTGMVTPPKAGTYRFVGFFDDLLIVYINNKPVLDGSWVPMAGVGEKKYDDELRQEFKGPPVAGSRTSYAGKWVKISEPVKLDIVVGETPGGRVGGLLMVEDKNGKYEMRSDGTHILPIFTTANLEADDLKRLKEDPYAKGIQFATDIPVFPGKKATFEKEERGGLGLLPERTTGLGLLPEKKP